jgi:hypothetical protein
MGHSWAIQIGPGVTPSRHHKVISASSYSAPGLGSTRTRAPVVRGQRPWQEHTASTGPGHRPSGDMTNEVLVHLLRLLPSPNVLQRTWKVKWIELKNSQHEENDKGCHYLPEALLMDKRRIPLRSASVRTPHLFHHGIPKVLVNTRSKRITSVRSTFTL